VTSDQLLPLLIGPYGALVLAMVVMWMLYRLFREERQGGREDRAAVLKMADVIKDLTTEIRSMREGMERRP
jgi:hypothetical protein